MSSDKQHSDFPWRAGSGGSIVCDDESLGPADADSLKFYGGRLVCETIEPRNRDFVIRACHAHDDLLAACEAAIAYLERNRPACGGDGGIIETVRAAMAKATPKTD